MAKKQQNVFAKQKIQNGGASVDGQNLRNRGAPVDCQNL